VAIVVMLAAVVTLKGFAMKKNAGTIDRAVRVGAGLLLIGLAASGTIGVWGYIGLVPLITGAIGMCPLYSVLGINTCPVTGR
jgi:hypothetical protein